MPIVRVRDLAMYHELHGEGDPLLLICGLGNDGTMFAPLIGPLAAHHRVIAFDNRGAGRTDQPDSPYSIEMMADDAAGLMTALGIEQAHVVGISMGGKIALALALRHPERVHSLVLVCTSAERRESLRLPWPWRLLGALQWLPPLRGRYPQPRYAHRHQRRASAAFDALARLGEIHVPTLILHGRKDRVAPFAQAERIQAGIAGSRLLAFRGGHLFFLLRERQPVLEAIQAFLSGLGDAARQEQPDAG